MRGLSLALAAAAAVWAGCVEKGAPAPKIDPAYIQKNLLAEEPAAIQSRVDANLGGVVVYLGNDVSPAGALAPGSKVSVVHYWKVIEPPGSEWRVFSHLVGGGKAWMNVDYTDMRVGYPPEAWKAGDIIRDEQSFELDGAWSASYAQLTVGLYQKGGAGEADRMAIESGPADRERRVLAHRFRVDRSAAPGQAQDYLVRRAAGAITLDGRADEPDWAAAAQSPEFTRAEGGPKLVGAARAKLLWDDEFLYAFIEVDDPDVHSKYTGQDDPLWKEDVVELFIDADGNRRGYVELQVNPRGAHFDAWFPRTRAQPHHFEWQSGMKSAVDVRGTLDERGDKDSGWRAEIAIPLVDVKGMDAAMKVAVPPAPGDRWQLNVIRVDKPKKGGIAASSWSPITIQDFHALDRMFMVVFAP
jgi:hypothetical protein